jgi:integral membrane protein
LERRSWAGSALSARRPLCQGETQRKRVTLPAKEDKISAMRSGPANPFPFFRTVGKLEAISYLALVLIAMPLKYIWSRPEAVRWVGLAHGILFILYCLALLRVFIIAKWPVTRAFLYFLASLIPFGPLAADGRLARHEQDFAQKGKSNVA